ncbi:PQQ-binding-like beta-propeller repeat protein [Natrinema halophilum]|uniref:PQQ-binding-like beta-propeller repeat protein n=1 Tax=Natrinema halophilum TaxID=1699371 RepID=A0A7D5K7G2_9EURY|nr:PQQ-binding-like beta-propeller repeat protein [Natrinema halophilum]QLG49963.1 PQQ-binding-like beta-propeller repeat protein [Natrinema halophilum]
MIEWNQYKGDPHNSGLRRDLEGPSRVVEGWTTDLVGIPGSPVLDRDTVYVGTSRGNCYALEAETGRRGWTFETTVATDATPVVTRDRLYLATADGTVYGLDSTTGDPQWRVELPGALESALALSDGRLYAGHADGLTALEAEMGAERWTFETESAVVGCPATADGRAVDRNRSSRNQLSGTVDSDLFDDDHRSETADRWIDERVFAGTANGTVLALEAESGDEVWTAPTAGAVTAGPTVAADRLYVGDDGGTMLALDAVTGKSWFTYEIRDSLTTSATVLAAAETTFVGGADGYLHVTDTTVGRRKLRGWLFSRKGIELDGPVRSCPVVVGDIVCVGDADGSLYGIGVDDCDPRWHFRADDAIAGTPAVAPGRLVVGTDDGRLRCLEWETDD